MDINALKQEAYKKLQARLDFKSFVLLKWERFNQSHFIDNWHYDYLCKVLEATLPLAARQEKHIQNNAKLIRQLMLNMPPSYGKTEIIARCFIAWALGNFPHRKFFYISYSDELGHKISAQVRALMKSDLFYQVFDYKPTFLIDNSSEFVLEQGGGLFVTTLKASLTGFHADQIIIDDPIKVSAMNSRAERNAVNNNFRGSVLSRLQNMESNITILMQRLGDDDLCGFLLDEKNYEDKSIVQNWEVLTLKALEKEAKEYKIADFCYKRAPNEPLFPAKHDSEGLEQVRLKMGNDEFSTQYLQEPIASEAGFFESVYFKTIPLYECGSQNLFIFVDNATSLAKSADNRALVLVGVESYKEALRYVVRDCLYGIWSEEVTLEHLLSLMSANPSAKVYIESDGGGLTLERLLQVELVKLNTQLKAQGKPQITNTIKVYTPSRKVAKVEKIKALRPFYNTGYLVFLHNARGLEQIKKELFSFNPEKPFRKDDCIDALSSALAHEDVKAPFAPQNSYATRAHKLTWRI